MKKISLSTLFVLLITINLISQDSIPNGSFEYWPGLNTPANWETTNQFLPPGTFTIKKVNSEIDTGYAIQLQTILLDAMIVPGVITLGNLDIGSSSGGVPFTERPNSLSAFVKHPSNGDEVAMFIEFFKAGETIGFGVWSTTDSIGTVMPINVPITFMTNENPDTMNITIMSDPWGPGSALMIDNLQFNFPMTEVSYNQPNELKVYPNPFSEIIRIEGIPMEAKQIDIYDLNGRLLITFHKSAQNDFTEINLNRLQTGIYILVISANYSVYRQKIIKN